MLVFTRLVHVAGLFTGIVHHFSPFCSKISFVANWPLFSLNSFIIAKKNHKNKRNRVGKVGFWPQNVKLLTF